jgi:3-methyladenine DNA glycosylase AlkD
MQIELILEQFHDFCRQNGDEAVIKKYSHYFVEGYDAYGISGTAMEEIHKTLRVKYRDSLGFEGFLNLGDRLVRTGKYEDASLALMFAADFTKQYQPAHFERFGQWLDDGICNWAHADNMAGGIFPVFLKNGIVPYTAFSSWRAAPSKWKRRVIPVSLIKPLKTCPDIMEWLEFLAPMMLMPEKVVHQGLGWFLREAWKLYPVPVEAFLLKWKETAPRLIFQYATEKMDTDHKARFKKIKG